MHGPNHFTELFGTDCSIQNIIDPAHQSSTTVKDWLCLVMNTKGTCYIDAIFQRCNITVVIPPCGPRTKSGPKTVQGSCIIMGYHQKKFSVCCCTEFGPDMWVRCKCGAMILHPYCIPIEFYFIVPNLRRICRRGAKTVQSQ
jgi:hypothetical protein